MPTQLLESTIKQLTVKGKGILAADESNATITKRFTALGIDSTEITRRDYREMLFTSQGFSDYIGGVILFEETLLQKTSAGQTFPELLQKLGVVPGIKVDKGLVQIPNTLEENTTQGLDSLADRLVEYKAKGARFAKWRAVYSISDNTPSDLAIRANAEGLARYAAICQSQGIVPIVEPEVLFDGAHTLQRCSEVSEQVFAEVFHALHLNRVSLEHMILKPSMVISGKSCTNKATVEQVAAETIKVLKRTVPSAVASINFLSGGQSPEDATAHLNAMNALFGPLPWNLSFSYARALQDNSMKTWQGNLQNNSAAQQAFIKRAKLNAAATLGKYNVAMEKEALVA